MGRREREKRRGADWMNGWKHRREEREEGRMTRIVALKRGKMLENRRRLG